MVGVLPLNYLKAEAPGWIRTNISDTIWCVVMDSNHRRPLGSPALQAGRIAAIATTQINIYLFFYSYTYLTLVFFLCSRRHVVGNDRKNHLFYSFLFFLVFYTTMNLWFFRDLLCIPYSLQIGVSNRICPGSWRATIFRASITPYPPQILCQVGDPKIWYFAQLYPYYLCEPFRSTWNLK